LGERLILPVLYLCNVIGLARLDIFGKHLIRNARPTIDLKPLGISGVTAQ